MFLAAADRNKEEVARLSLGGLLSQRGHQDLCQIGVTGDVLRERVSQIRLGRNLGEADSDGSLSRVTREFMDRRYYAQPQRSLRNVCAKCSRILILRKRKTRWTRIRGRSRSSTN